MIPLKLEGIAENKYGIEEDGRIYSFHIKDYMKTRKDKDGYLRISLRKPDGNIKTWRIATLVLLSFKGPPPNNLLDPTVNHIDGNRINNHISNLEWLERGENTRVRKNVPTGIKNKQAKLTEQQVITICELLSTTNLTLKEIADKFNISISTVHDIKQKNTWINITNKYDFNIRQTIRDLNGRYKTVLVEE